MKVGDAEKWNGDFELSEDNLRELFKLASVNEINIFIDANGVIKRLCAALLEEKGVDPWVEKKT